MKCVVFGGGGFIGSHLCEELSSKGHKVRAFDRAGSRFLADVERAGAHVLTGDFFNEADIRAAIVDSEIVYHLISATVPQTSNDNPILDVESNILGTLRLLDAARDAGVKKIIFSSSGGTVYGIPKEIPIKENHSTNPISSYGIVKLAIEKYLHLYWTLYGLDYCILRIANAYGKRQPVTDTQGVIASFLAKALTNSEITVWGNGTAIRDYVYASDIAKAFLRAAVYTGDTKLYNIGSGQGHSLNDIIAAIEEITKRRLKIKHIPGRPFDVGVNILDISLAKMDLNWQPAVGLLEGISAAREWMIKQGKM